MHDIFFFQNVHVEVLYQRYFLRMNQNNMTSLLILLVIIATTMIVVNYAISSADSIMQVTRFFIFVCNVVAFYFYLKDVPTIVRGTVYPLK